MCELDFEYPIYKDVPSDSHQQGAMKIQLKKSLKPYLWENEPRITSLSISNDHLVSFMDTKNYYDFKSAFELIAMLIAYDNLEEQADQKQYEQK